MRTSRKRNHRYDDAPAPPEQKRKRSVLIYGSSNALIHVVISTINISTRTQLPLKAEFHSNPRSFKGVPKLLHGLPSELFDIVLSFCTQRDAISAVPLVSKKAQEAVSRTGYRSRIDTLSLTSNSLNALMRPCIQSGKIDFPPYTRRPILARLLQSLRGLRSLVFTCCPDVDDHVFELVATYSPKSLRVFSVDWCSRVSDRGISAIAQSFPSLQRFSLFKGRCGSRITDASLVALEKHCPLLTNLHLAYTEVSEEGVSKLARQFDLNICRLIHRTQGLEYGPTSVHLMAPDVPRRG